MLFGQLPDSIKGMKSLRKYRIAFIHFFDVLQYGSSCFLHLISAGVLDLSNNRLSGPLPGKIGDLKKIRILDLSNNSFSGELPKNIGKLKDARQVVLSLNLIQGNIPADIRKMKNLGMYYKTNCFFSS